MKNYFVFTLLCLCLLDPVTLMAGKDPKPPEAGPPVAGQEKIMRERWSKALTGGGSKKKYYPEMASPVVSDGIVYVGTHSGLFYAVKDDGSVRVAPPRVAPPQVAWKFDSEGPIASQAIVSADNVFFGNNKGMFYALNRGDGRLVWKVYLGGEILVQPLLLGSTVYVVTTSREIYALNQVTGETRWVEYIRGFESLYTMRGNASVIGNESGLYIAFADGQVIRMNPSSGQVVWSRNLAGHDSSFKDIDAAILLEGGSLYVAGYFDKVFKLSPGDGQTIWSKEVGSGSKLVIAGDTLFIAENSGNVVAMNASSGIRQWDVALNSGALSSPVSIDSYLLVGTGLGTAYVFEQASGKIVQRVSLGGGVLSDLVKTGEQIYALSAKAHLLALALEKN